MESHLSCEALARFLTEDITPQELAAEETHLRVCVDCRAKLDDLTATTPAAAAAFRLRSSPPSSLSTAPPGFELLGPLGDGKTATVYQAWQPHLKRFVALKPMPGGWPTEPEARRRFQVEIEAATRLNHPGVVQVYDVATHEGRPVLVMEYCPGGSLARRLREVQMSPREAAELIETLARTMQDVHAAELIHRDLKPAN